MTKFSDKISRGSSADSQEWNEFLRTMHDQDPSQTPEAFAAFKTKDGKNSYEILAQAIDPTSDEIALCQLSSAAITIVDLACGDGYLIPFCLPKIGLEAKVFGFDMSEGGLEVARANVHDPRVTLQAAEAHKLPLEAGSVDLVLCHMAFMLMDPIVPIVEELARVLKSGASFVAVIGTPSTTAPFIAKVMKNLAEFQTREFANFKGQFSAGDARTRSYEGLKELFNAESGFENSLETGEFELEIDIAPAEAWDRFKSWYNICWMPEDKLMLWKNDLINLAISESDADGRLRYRFPMMKFTVRKAIEIEFRPHLAPSLF